MRRYLYSNLLRITIESILTLVFLPSSALLTYYLIIEKRFNPVGFILSVSCLLFWVIGSLVILILDKKASNSVLFEKGRLTYKNRVMYPDTVSIRYFKFCISVLEPSLVIPKVLINGNDLRVTCYLTKRDVKRIKKMGFEIKEI